MSTDGTFYKKKYKYGTVQEFSHIKTINIDFSLVWFVSLYV